MPSAFQPTVLTLPASSSGSGSGEINSVLNPSAAADTTGWTNAARVTSGSPLDPIVTTAFSISNAAAAESSTSGGYYSITTLADGLKNKKLKVEFYFKTPASDTYKVSVYKAGTRVPLSTDSSGSTSLPQNTTGKFVAYFDTDSTSAYSVNVTRTSGTTGPCLITQVVVGPGIQPQGAVVGPEIAYSLTVGGSASAPTLGTNSAQAVYERIGDVMHIRYSLKQTSAGTAGSGTYLFPLPSGFTVDSSRLSSAYQGSTGLGSVGAASLYDGTKQYTGYVAAYNSTNLFLVLGNEITTPSAMGSTTYSLAGANIWLSFDARIPIAEWAGSGTVQLAQNDVEYAYNTGSWDATDSTSFGQGPSGQLITASTDLTDLRKKRVRFQSPIQSGDSIVVEFQVNGTWVPALGAAGSGDWNIDTFSYATTSASTSSRGIGWKPVSGSTTDIDVYFGRYAAFYNNATAIGWSTYISSTVVRWRVRKSSAGAAVGFGIVQPGVSSGLVSSLGLPGKTDGLAVTTGYVGEVVHSPQVNGALSLSGSGTWKTISSISLTKGTWLVCAQAGTACGATAASGFTGLYAGLSITTNSDPGAGQKVNMTTVPTQIINSSFYYQIYPRVVTVTAVTQDWYLNQAITYSSANNLTHAQDGVYIVAHRIA